SGGSWHSGDSVDTSNGFKQVSCSSASFCMAVDGSGDAASFNGSRWAAGTVPGDAVTVSCPDDGYCVAADNAGGVMTYTNGSWSKITKVDGNNTFDALSCPSASACLAADSNNNVLYYAPAR